MSELEALLDLVKRLDETWRICSKKSTFCPYDEWPRLRDALLALQEHAQKCGASGRLLLARLDKPEGRTE